MTVYFYIAKMKLLVFLAYRFEVFAALGTNLIIIVANIFLWETAYKGIDTVSGVNKSQMITYMLMSILISSFFSSNVENSLQERITKGDIAIDLFRPINIILSYFAEDVGIAFSSLISKLVPLLLIMVIFIQTPKPSSFAAFVLFILSSCLSFIILWLISAMIAMLCFWFLQLGELKTIKDGIVLILSGKIIPLWLFPEHLQSAISFLPFPYIYQTPLSIYIGKIPSNEIAFSMSIQLIWILLFTALVYFSWGKAKKRVLVQGG